MDKHTLTLLDFKKITKQLSSYCLSERGKLLILEQEISNDSEKVKELISATTAFHSILELLESFPAFDFPEITIYYRRLSKKSAFLEAEECAAIGRYILSAVRIKQLILKNTQNPFLINLVSLIPVLNEQAEYIFTFVDNEGNVKEDKIPELKSIKKRITDLYNSVDKLISRYMENPDYDTYWQSDVPTMRQGRAVLPIKANFKGRIKGIVHEISSSGATVFLEPHDVVEKNNQIINMQNEYKKTLLKLLKKITSKISESLSDIKIMEEKVALLDTIYARAVYGRIFKGWPAEYSKNSIHIENGRHPLLADNVVPITISMDDSLRVLIITGPNTGGKTVSLKTVGLLCLMNQFGMEIPADEVSKLPVFDNIFADIGDEQSIEQSLSTFSGHIVNLARIIEKSTEKSLILLDELGAGTDPEEGVAIAMVILDHFIEKGCCVLSTTHHGILKNYGYTRNFVQNASMEFDTETLTPLYSIIMGIPGESYALTIAKRHGIPQDLIEKAKHYLNDERTDVAKLIKTLSEKQRELLNKERIQRVQESELKEKRRKADLKALKLRQKEYELRKDGITELKRFLLRSRRELENIVREIWESELTKAKLQNVRDFINSVEEVVFKEEEKLESQQDQITDSDDIILKKGMNVCIKNTGKKGRILRKGKGKTWIVETETLKISLLPHEIIPDNTDEDVDQMLKISTSIRDIESVPHLQLDVRGCSLEEAITKLEKQIDSAIIRGMREFGVVHGKGDGILQQGIHNYLKKCRYIKDYYFSRPEEGGFGRTVVILKS